MRIKITLITIFTALFFITGCASIEPFPQNTSLGKSDASRITIESKMEAHFNFNDNVPYGKLFLNSQSQGTFHKSQRKFTKEISPGNLTVMVCNADNNCVHQTYNVQANTHIFLDYVATIDYTYWRWRIVNIKTENYTPMNRQTEKQSKNLPVVEEINENKKTIQNDNLEIMKVNREKCLSLGFKLNTDEFGKCMISITK